MERIDGNTWRTDNGDEVRARGLRLTVEFGERTKAEILSAVEAVRTENEKLKAENADLKDAMQTMYDLFITGKVDACDLCDRLGECENHPAPSPCKYECKESVFVDWLKEIGIEVVE